MASLVNPCQVFGINENVKQNVIFIDDDTVLFPSGMCLAIFGYKNQSQKFIQMKEGLSITTLTYSRPLGLIAVALTTDKAPIIVVYEYATLKKRRTFTPSDGFTGKSFISVHFSPDGRHVIGQSAGPEWQLFLWSYEKGRVITSVKTSSNFDVYQTGCNPFDLLSTVVSIGGSGLFKVFRFDLGQLRAIVQHKPDYDVICHTWVTEKRIVAATSKAKLVVYENADILKEIDYVLTVGSIAVPSFDAIASYFGGILVGASDGRAILFEKSDDESFYKRDKEFQLDKYPVTSLSINVSEDVAVCTLKNSQIYNIPLESESKYNEIPCQVLFQEYHHGQIIGMDVCARKPLIATCGVDRAVRVWNYMENTEEVSKKFEDEPQSLSIHPSGLYLLVGFADGIKLMNILIDNIVPFHEVAVRGCRECQFSNGGQYFAVVSGSSIVIYNTWTFALMHSLKGHTGKVKTIYWSNDDQRIISGGMDGKICSWNIRVGKKEWEHESPNVIYSSITIAPTSKSIFAVGSDGLTRELTADGQGMKEYNTKSHFTRALICRSGRLFISYGTNGSVKVSKFPFLTESAASNMAVPLQISTVVNILEQATEIRCHNAPVTKVCFSYDENYMFTCGEDGCIWVYKTFEKSTATDKSAIKKETIYSDEMLITKTELKKSHQNVLELKQQLEHLKTANEETLAQRDILYKEKLDGLVIKYSEELSDLQLVVGQLKEEQEINSPKWKQELENSKKNNANEIKRMTNVFDKKIEVEHEKFTEIQNTNKTLEEQWQGHLANIESFHQTRMDEISKYYNDKLEERSQAVLNMKADASQKIKDYELNLIDIENIVDIEAIEILNDYEAKMKEEKEGLGIIRQENITMKSTFERLKKEVDERKAEITKLMLEEKRLSLIIKGLSNDTVVLKREVLERDETIMDKEKRIYDLKKKNQELEKFKFVLDFKILELKKQVEPREADIITLSETLGEMVGELEGYRKKGGLLYRDYHILTNKLKIAQTEIMNEVKKKRQMTSKVQQISRDIDSVKEFASKPNELKAILTKMYHKYKQFEENPVSSNSKKRMTFTQSELKTNGSKNNGKQLPKIIKPGQDHVREREHLERTITTLNKSIVNIEESNYTQNLRLMKENSVLISEINLLRAEFKNSEERIKVLDESLLQAKIGKLTRKEKLKFLVQEGPRPEEISAAIDFTLLK